MSTKRFENMDADESIFFARQLDYVKKKSYDVIYAELKARRLIPVSSEAGAGAEAIRYEQYDQVGMAKVISSYGTDLPRADIKGKEFISAIKSLGDSYGYSLQEIRAAKFAGKPLEQRRANAARRAIMQLENTIAFSGDAANNLGGFLTNPNLSSVTLLADGTGSSKAFSTKDSDKILRDLNQVVNFIVENTKGVEVPDTLLLPIAQFNLCATKRVGLDSTGATNRTVLEYFLATSPYIKNVEWVNELKGAGASSTDRMVAYKRDPDKLTLEIPQDFEQLDVQMRNLEYVVPCHSRCGGVLVYYPLSICYADGI